MRLSVSIHLRSLSSLPANVYSSRDPYLVLLRELLSLLLGGRGLLALGLLLGLHGLAARIGVDGAASLLRWKEKRNKKISGTAQVGTGTGVVSRGDSED